MLSNGEPLASPKKQRRGNSVIEEKRKLGSYDRALAVGLPDQRRTWQLPLQALPAPWMRVLCLSLQAPHAHPEVVTAPGGREGQASWAMPKPPLLHRPPPNPQWKNFPSPQSAGQLLFFTWKSESGFTLPGAFFSILISCVLLSYKIKN